MIKKWIKLLPFWMVEYLIRKNIVPSELIIIKYSKEYKGEVWHITKDIFLLKCGDE